MPLNLENIDLGSFGVSKDSESQPDTQLRSSLSEAVKVNPDSAAKVKQLSSASGIPAFAVEQDPASVETKLNLDKIDFSTMSKRSPNTSKFLTDFNNASIAHDDVDSLQFLENVMKSINPLPSEETVQELKQYGADITRAFKVGQAQVRASDIGMQRLWSALNIREPVTDDQIEQLKQAEAEMSSDPTAEYGFLTGAPIAATQQLPILGEILGSAITEASGGAVKGGAVGGSIGVIRGRGLPIPAQAASVTAGVAAGGVMGAQYGARFGVAKESFDLEAGSAFNEYAALKDEQGNVIDQQSAAYAATAVGAINASLEYVSLAAVGRTVTPVMRSMIRSKVKQALATETGRQVIARIGTSYLAAVGTEAVTEGLQEFTTVAGGELSKLISQEAFTEQSISDSLDAIFSEETLSRVGEAFEAGAQVGLVFGAPGTAFQVIQETQKREQSGQNEQVIIDQLNEVSTESKLKQRDAEAFKQFINDADGDQNTTVFIDGAQAALYLSSKNRAEIEKDPALQLIRDQVNEASRLGTDVAIPAADFAATVAGTPHFDALREDMTLSADSVSPFRAEQVQQETRQYVQTLMSQAQENVSQYVEAQQIYDTVRTQLIDTGMVTPQNASTMAQLVPAWATVHAQQNGMTVQEVYQQSGLTIEGPQTGRMAEVTGQVLEQSQPPETFDVAWPDDTEVGENPATITAFVKGKTDAFVFAEDNGDGSYSIKESGLPEELRGKGFGIGMYETLIGELTKRNQQITSDSSVSQDAQKIYQALERRGFTITQNPDAVVDEETGALEADGPVFTITPAAPLRQEAQPQSARDFKVELQQEFPDVKFGFSQTGNVTTLDKIIVPEDQRTAGTGTAAMQRIVDWADQNGQTVALTPSADFGGSKKRLTEFYKRFGFIENKGRNKDFEINESMYRPAAEVLTQRPDGAPEARGYYDPANAVIRLTEAADLSTFLHEFAHFMYEMERKAGSETSQKIGQWFKRNADDVAKEAQQEESGVTAEDVVAFVDTNTTGDKGKDRAIYRAIHEQFARGFETYLMEGTAPSIELRNAFRSFARWLTQIYRAIKGNLKVNLDAEMRQVFDRMLAAEDQIAAAEARARYEPMFTDAAMAGMTEEEFAAYKKRQEKVKDKQSETLREKLIKELTRKTEAWWKEEKADLVAEEIESLQDQPVYVAANRLRTGDIKLDYVAVREMTGEERTDKLGRKRTHLPSELNKMTVKGGEGVHPDEAAAFFGYNSGDEMLTDIITAPKIKDLAESNAEKRMLEKHGDILNDGTIEQQADEAVQTEERGKLILAELKALSKGTNQPVFERQIIKALAEERIGQLAFREIFPARYRKAEIKAAQESAKMLAEGNREGAAGAKARQVLNYYLGMAATAAKSDTMNIVDRMGRYNTKRVREAIQKADGGYWDQIVKILGRFEFRKSATLKEVQDINTWVRDRIEQDGDGLVLSPEVLNESMVTHWKNVPFSQLQGIADSVKNIEHVARYANKIDVLQEKMDFDTLVSSWTDHIKSISTKYTTKESRSRAEDVSREGFTEKVNKFISQMTKVPFLASWLDGGERVGMSHDIMVQRFTDALNDKLNLMDEVARPVYDMIADRDKETRARHARKIHIPEINDDLYGHQVLAVALNTGNQSNLKKMLLGEGWANPENEAEITFSNPKLQAVLQHMTRADWVMVQKIWDQMELLYPQLAEVHRRTTGLVPPKIESTPIQTPYGEFKGGYYPVKYSPKRGYDAEKNAEKQQAETESMFSNYSSINASVNAGATNERTGFYAPILLDLSVIPDHFHETIHFITHHDAVRQMNKLINDKRVQSAITGAVGEEEFKQLKPWINDIAKDGREQPTKTFIHRAFNQLRFGVTLGAMGFKASTGIMQFFGLFTTAAELGVGPTIKGVRSAIGGAWYMRAIRKTLGSTSNMESSWKFASDKSKVLKHRTDTMDREIRAAMERLSGKRGFIAATQEVSMKHIALIQTYMVDMPTWFAAYDKTISETGDETRAITYADWAVENLQGSGATKDMAQILRNQDKIHTTFTMFMTFFSSLGNLSRDTYRGAKDGKYSLTNTAAKLMFLYTLPVFIEMLMRGEFEEPEDEDERLQKFLTNLALYPVASVPFARDVASGVFSEYGYNVTPVASLLERGIMGYKQIGERAFTDEEITAGALKGAVKLTGAAFGIPGVNQAWSTWEHLYDVIEEGEDLTLRQVLFGPDRD